MHRKTFPSRNINTDALLEAKRQAQYSRDAAAANLTVFRFCSLCQVDVHIHSNIQIYVLVL